MARENHGMQTGETAHPVGAWIQTVTFNDGQCLSFANDDLVLFVGPNNSGKSATMRDLHMRLHNAGTTSNVVRSITLTKKGTGDELGVPTAVVADFDVLQEEQDLSRIVPSLGGNWSTIEHDWRLTKNAIGAKKPELSGLE